MINHRDGSKSAENLIDIMKCLIGGMVSVDNETNFQTRIAPSGNLESNVNGIWMPEMFTLEPPCVFRKPEPVVPKEPEWFGWNRLPEMVRTAGVSSLTVKIFSENGLEYFDCRDTGLSFLKATSASCFCLTSDYDRWQAELAAAKETEQPKIEVDYNRGYTFREAMQQPVKTKLKGYNSGYETAHIQITEGIWLIVKGEQDND